MKISKMQQRVAVLIVLLCLGCSRAPAPPSSAQRVQRSIDGWNQMGMWLPDSEQIEFFRSNWLEAEQPLALALKNPAYDVRMRAAYVLEGLGSDARPLGPVLVQRLQVEPDRLVRMYMYGALQAIRYKDPPTIALLKGKFESLDENSPKPDTGESKSEYLDADEKIRVAMALWVLDQSPDRKRFLNFVLEWLRDPGDPQSPSQRHELWQRRWGAVLALEGVPDASVAIPLLQALGSEKDAPPWVSVHVPRVVESLR